MVVREKQDVVVGFSDLFDELVAALPDVRRCLAARTAVAPQVPDGPFVADLGGRRPLVLAIPEFDQQLGTFGVGEAGQSRRLRGSREWAGEHPTELVGPEDRRERSRLLLAA